MLNYPECRIKYSHIHPDLGEAVYHVKDYPEIGAGKAPVYFHGDYVITESKKLLIADCVLKADSHLIIGAYDVMVNIPLNFWYIHSVGTVGFTTNNLPKNWWIGSKNAYGWNYTKVPPTIILPSKVRRLLGSLLDEETPAALVADHILSDLASWDSTLIYELENGRHNGSFWNW